MKKYLFTLLFFIAFTPLIIKAETCDKEAVKIESIECIDKSRNIKNCDGAVINDDNDIELNLDVYEVGDNATYEIIIKNDSDDDYELNKNDFNLNSDYIDYEFEPKNDTNVLGANTSNTVYLTIEYANEVPREQFENGEFIDNKNVKVNILAVQNELINPETRTGAYILIGVLIIAISSTLYVLLKKKRYKEFMALLITSLVVIPITVYAICSYDIDLSSSVNIHDEPYLKDFLIENYPDRFTKYEGLVTDEVGKTVEASNVYFATSQTNNNVIFGNFCWQIYRTTEQGGAKLIYNGVVVNGTCPTRSSYTERTIGSSKYSSVNNSIAYVGYMYNKVYVKNNNSYYNNNQYGTNVTYEDGMYTLVNPSNIRDNNHRFTCIESDDPLTCEKVVYYYRYSDNITLENGNTPLDALNEMFFADDVNTNDSTIKTYIDNWYEENLLDYTEYLDDNVYCNDRTIIDMDTNGWNPEGDTSIYLHFRNYNREQELDCQNITDQFSTANEKAQLKYPIALITEPERYQSGGRLVGIGQWYWTMSPIYYRWDSVPFVSYVMGQDGYFGDGYFYSGDNVSSNYTDLTNVRPVIGLYKYDKIIAGDGSYNNPFVIDTNIDY